MTGLFKKCNRDECRSMYRTFLWYSQYCPRLEYNLCTGRDSECRRGSRSDMTTTGRSSEMRLEMKSSLFGRWWRRLKTETMVNMREGGGGHTVDEVLTIPWVISQLSMGSSWSAGLSSPFTLSWINNRITPYTREERPHHSKAHSAERETESKSNVQEMTVVESEENSKRKKIKNARKMATIHKDENEENKHFKQWKVQCIAPE